LNDHLEKLLEGNFSPKSQEEYEEYVKDVRTDLWNSRIYSVCWVGRPYPIDSAQHSPCLCYPRWSYLVFSSSIHAAPGSGIPDRDRIVTPASDRPLRLSPEARTASRTSYRTETDGKTSGRWPAVLPPAERLPTARKVAFFRCLRLPTVVVLPQAAATESQEYGTAALSFFVQSVLCSFHILSCRLPCTRIVDDDAQTHTQVVLNEGF
jgi:hypothetical protein